MEKENKKKSGKLTVYLVVLAIAALFILGLEIKLNWERFRVEASFGFTFAVVVLVAALILFFIIRHNIRKAKKEKEQKRLEWERERQAKIEAGEPVSSLGDGKFEMSDVAEAAAIAGEKISGIFEKIQEEPAEEDIPDEQ